MKTQRSQGKYQISDMDAILRDCGIVLARHQLDQLWAYHNLLRQSNPELNLTRIHNFRNMVEKLYVDSILPGQMMELPSPLLDLGTGPGMPGIPLKIAFPDLEMILAESRGKRVEFLEVTIHDLKLENITVVGKSITSRFETPVNAVITRAVEAISATLVRITGCLAKDGLAVFMKGPGCDAEIDAAADKLGGSFRLKWAKDYQIPGTNHDRRLVVFERTDTPLREQRNAAMQSHFFTEIESEQNAVFKDLKKLLTGRGIKKSQTALISGEKQVAEALDRFPERCKTWISAPGQKPPPEGAPGQMKWYQLAPPLFKILDVIGTNSPLVLMETPPMRLWDPAGGLPEGASVLVPFQDPENVGAVIRSAVAFGLDHIILLSESAHPFHPKSVRASGGAVLFADLWEGPSIQTLSENLPIVALSGDGAPIGEFAFPETVAFLPGIEGPGLPDKFRDRALSIPIRREVESLNAATAAAIGFYVWSQGRFHDRVS
ncbi:MAG: 16S rRNA (guanine(527)-N(7))-methyltransferase RsmG [Desulfobacterales bacterium CG23_combo_of_CG06-09_8_20_14_all_51_8]|nr:MAG: 16S rRNA (guanine(527)-N(7))-methyltransferase RsmG [Desulfobacterales bacterium CG23_combo_of_CG06-09_8_20_14_all_51_8]